MSQISVEQVLGRLLCDDSFRSKFYKDPERTLGQLGVRVTRVELSGLRRVSRTSVESLAKRLDDRIRRATEALF